MCEQLLLVMVSRYLPDTGALHASMSLCIVMLPFAPEALPRLAYCSAASDLLLVDLKGIAIRHLEGFRCVRRLHARALEQESNAGDSLALTLAEGRHELLQLRALLDLKEHLVVIVRHLDVQVFGRRRRCLFGRA